MREERILNLMTGSSQANEDDLQLSQDGDQVSQLNLDEPSEKEDSELSLKESKGKGLSEEVKPLSKGKKKKGAKSNKKKSVDIDEYSLGGIKYKLPGKKQRIIVASLVLGLNILLVIAVILYFNNPGFQDFIYHVGRDV